MTHDIDIIGVTAVRRFSRERQARIGQKLAVQRGNLAAPGDILFDLGQLGQQDGGLDLVEAGIVAVLHCVVGLFSTIKTQPAQFPVPLFPVRIDHAAVTIGTQDFGRIERGRGDVAHAARLLTLVFSTLCLRTVFQDKQAVPARNLQDRIHVRTLAEQMDGKDYLGPGRDGGFQLVNVHQVRAGIDIHEYRRRTGRHDSRNRRDGRVRHRDYLIPRTDAERIQCQDDGVGSVVAAHAILRSYIIRISPLEILSLLTQDQDPRLEDIGHCLEDFVFRLLIFLQIAPNCNLFHHSLELALSMTASFTSASINMAA